MPLMPSPCGNRRLDELLLTDFHQRGRHVHQAVAQGLRSDTASLGKPSGVVKQMVGSMAMGVPLYRTLDGFLGTSHRSKWMGWKPPYGECWWMMSGSIHINPYG